MCGHRGKRYLREKYTHIPIAGAQLPSEGVVKVTPHCGILRPRQHGSRASLWVTRCLELWSKTESLLTQPIQIKKLQDS